MLVTIKGKNYTYKKNVFKCLLVLFGITVLESSAAQEVDSMRRMQEVIVTAQYFPQSLGNSVYKITVIDKKRIEACGATDVKQVLNTATGIRFSNDKALGTTDISLMGMGGRNIKILLDGVPLADRGDTRESLNQLDVSQIERIEIVEGPMSIVYGSDALAGVINIITKKTDYKSIRINALVQEETAGTEYKPFDLKGLHTQRVGASFDNGKWNAMASVLHYNFTGFGANKNGRAHSWKPKEQWMPSIRIGYKNNKANIYYRNDYLHETITAKAAMNSDTYKAFTQQFITNRMAQQLQGNYFFNERNSLNATVGYTNYQRNTRTTLVDYKNGTQSLSNGDGEQDIAKLHSFNFRSTLQYYASSKITVQPGIEINYEKAMGARIKGTPSITNYSFFLSAEYKPVQKLNIRPGFRINKNTSYNAPPFMPSLNILYNINDDFSLRAAYARGYRAPALREFYFDFVDANHNLKGNPNLKAEHSQSINASVNYKKNIHQNTFSSELAGFYNVFNDLIDLGMNPANNQEFIYINVDKYKTTGLSLNNRFACKSLEVSVGALLLGQYNRLKNNTALKNEAMPIFNTSCELSVEAMYRIAKTKTGLNFFYKYTGKRGSFQAITDAKENVVVKPTFKNAYHYADANVQQYINPYLQATAGVRNLFNVTDIQNTSSGTGAHSSGGALAFSYGRSYYVSLYFNFITHKKSNQK